MSAVIGTYSHPVAMTTDKFSVPYLVTSTLNVRQQRHQLNVVNILPLSVDLVAVTVDIISLARWTSVAVVSEPDLGTPTELTISTAFIIRLFVCPMLCIMHGQNINLPVCVCLCVYLTLSVNSPTGQTPQRIFTVSLKNANLRKDVPFGVMDDE